LDTAIATTADLAGDLAVIARAEAVRPDVAAASNVIEATRRLPPALLDRLHEAQLFRLLLPRSSRGIETDPVTFFHVIETIAKADASTAWCLSQAGGCAMSAAYLDLPVAQAIFGDPSAVLAWGPGPKVKAVECEGGYRVTGRWSFGSGSPEASWMLGSFQILDDGKPRLSPEGKPLYWRGFFSRAEVEIVPGSWDVTGLRGNGSFDWTVHDVFLPERRTMVHAGVPLDNQWDRWPGVTYSLPTQCWIGPHHSAVITGIARAGIDALIELAGGKTPRGRTGLLCDNPQVQDAVGRADAILNAGRAYRSAMITELWNSVAAGKGTTLEQRARCRLASTYAADSARQAIDLVYRHGGSTSFKRDSRLAECWRDLHTVGQTVTLAPEWYPIGGRVYLGIDPGPRLR